MKIHVANLTNKTGGGWTIQRYLAEVFNSSYEEAEVYLIVGATQVSYEDVEQAKRDGKKVVLRVDNHLLPSRNRNTGMSRLKTFSEQADLVIYQSRWARDYLKEYLNKDGVVILNGVDTSLFNADNRTESEELLYIRSSRIAEKGWERARYWVSRNHADRKLNIVGKFSPDNIDYYFDFYNNEQYTFWGEQPRQNVVDIMKSSKYFLYSYFMDACSNTLLEARACGMEIVDIYGDLLTGGAKEIMQLEDLSKERMVREYKEAMDVLL